MARKAVRQLAPQGGLSGRATHALSGAGEAALAQAYELGREATRHGIGVVEMAMVHHEALVQLLSATPERPALVVEAARFFAESLAAFELSLRADVALRHAKVAAE